jgi:hypothetical protein
VMFFWPMTLKEVRGEEVKVKAMRL